MGIKGCWTCRERKVRCDSRWPRCGNCTKAQRVCRGYGIQLSWPRNGDRKRSLISHETTRAANVRYLSASKFLNIAVWDMSLSEELQSGRSLGRYLRTMKVPRPNYLSPSALSREESHLLEFFNESRSLILGPTDEENLVRSILRTALSDPSDAANPVLQGVFALASLHLHGTSKSFHYKHLVISAVKEPVNWVSERTLFQNLMALMLLYHYELSLDSSSKGSWVVFLCAVKRIINTSPTAHKLVRQEYSVFLDWIFYHEVFAEFAVRHWVVPYQGCGYAPTARSRAIKGNGSMVDNNIGCPTDVLQLVAHASRHAIDASPAEINWANSESERRAKELEHNISRSVRDYGPIRVPSSVPTDRDTTVSDIHRLACLIYVNRAVHCISGSDFRHRQLVRDGIWQLTRLKTCQHAWPLFIIACEAADDGQRLAVLDVFEQSRRDLRRRSSHVSFIQHMVQAVWNQHDLDTENQLDYLTVFDAVIGGVPFMPVFA